MKNHRLARYEYLWKRRRQKTKKGTKITLHKVWNYPVAIYFVSQFKYGNIISASVMVFVARVRAILAADPSNRTPH